MANTELINRIKENATEYNLTKFQEYDISGTSFEFYNNLAKGYAQSYSGDFPFMLDIQKQVWEDKSLSPKQVAAVLNCALREAKDLPDTTPPVFELKGKDPLGIDGTYCAIHNTRMDTDDSGLFCHQCEVGKVSGISDINKGSIQAVNTKTGDTYSVTVEPELTLEAVNKRMKIASDKLAEFENSNMLEELQNIIDSTKQEETDLFIELHKKVDSLRNARTDAESRIKSFEYTLSQLRKELELLTLEQQKQEEILKATARLNEITDRLNSLKENAPWKETIREYQWDDVCYNLASFIEGRNGVLNANPMGLGKTFETVASLWLLVPIFEEKFGCYPKILWLTKKSLMRSSIKEFQRWWPEVTPIPVSGNQNQRKFIVELATTNNHPVVVNYDALNTTDILRETKWDIVVMDEVHKLKGGANYKPTRVWENTADVCQKAKFIMPLSGSPIQNHPKEMWAYLYLLDPVRFPDVKDFINRFCQGYDDGISVEWDRLIKILSNRVIRKNKAEVLTELPDKDREFRYLEMLPKQREIYDHLKQHFFVWLDEQKENELTTTSILAQLTRLRQVAIMPGSIKIEQKMATGEVINRQLECNESAKIDEAMDIIEQLIGEGEQVVVFSSQFNEPLRELHRRIVEEFKITCETLTGENSAYVNEIEERFQRGETRVLCINSKTGGEGLNLQVASHAIFLDLWYNPKFNEQCEDRLHRMGQKNAVTIHILQCENSVDAFIADILDKKEAMIGAIIEDKSLRKEKGWRSYLTDLL